MSAIIESFYLSILLFWAVVSIVSLGILMMPCFLGKRNKQKRVVFYLMALNFFVLIGLFFGIFEYFFKTLGDFNLFFIGYILFMILMCSFIIIDARKLVNVHSFLSLIFLLVLIMIILIIESLYDKTFLATISIALLCAVITFYISVFSSLCMSCRKIMISYIFSKKEEKVELEDLI